MTAVRVPFASLAPREDGDAVRTAIARVVASGWYVLGPEVEAFEQEFAQACGSTHAVGVGSRLEACLSAPPAPDASEAREEGGCRDGTGSTSSR